MTQQANQSHTFEFHRVLDQNTTLSLLGIRTTREDFNSGYIDLEVNLTEDETIEAVKALYPSSFADPREIVRRLLKSETVEPDDLFDSKLPAFAQEYSEATGQQYDVKPAAEIPMETVANLLALADANHWERHEKDWDITIQGIALLNSSLKFDEQEPLDPLSFLTPMQQNC